MSRHPAKLTTLNTRQEKVAEEFVDYLAQVSTPNAFKLHDIALATECDSTLQAVMEAIQTSNWYEPANKCLEINVTKYKAMERVKGDLTVCTSFSIILRGNRVVFPEAMQQRVVDIAHEGHQGIVKTKSLLREKVWFAGMDGAVDKKVKSCLTCQAATPETKREPLQMSPLPTSPWLEVSIDFKELSPGYLLVVTDDYSRYPVVEIVHTTASKIVIPHLNKTFAEFGVPEVVRSDNGPPFNGKEFKAFANALGFKHRKVTPLWPRANGEVERFMRTLKRSIEAAKTEHRPWKEELCKFLRNYRATPHTTTGKPAATALFNRPLRTKLPECPISLVDPASIQKRDQEAKQKMKEYADSKIYVKPSRIAEGDTALAKRDPSYKKSATAYDPEPYVVTTEKGSMVTARREDKEITRNSSFFKSVSPNIGIAAEEDDLVQETLPTDAQVTEEEPPTRCYPLRSSRKPPKYHNDYV